MMLRQFANRLGRLLDFPAPQWLSNYARRDLDREIAALEIERAGELALPVPRDEHLQEIEKGLAELRRLRAGFP